MDSSALGHHSLGLGAHDTTTPVLAHLISLLIVVGLDTGNEGSKLLLVLRLDLSDGNAGGSLLVDQSSETALALDDGEGDSHLAAESGHPDNQLNGLNVVGNQNQLSLLGLNQGSDVVKTELGNDGLLVGGSLLTLGLGSGNLLQAILLLNLALGLVLGEETEDLGGSVLVQGALELVDGGRDLQALLQDGTLALEANVQRPLDVASQVAARLDVVTDGEVARALLEEAALGRLFGNLLRLGN